MSEGWAIKPVRVGFGFGSGGLARPFKTVGLRSFDRLMDPSVGRVTAREKR